MLKRLLALDYGEKRMGLAISDPLNSFALPLDYLENNKDFYDELQKIIREYQIEKIILGLPLNLKGKDSQKTKEVRLFAEELKIKTNCYIEFQDERFSTMAVSKQLQEVKSKKRRKNLDSQAAAFFLQGYLDKIRRL
jgi:putative Holliday junction resolvase